MHKSCLLIAFLITFLSFSQEGFQFKTDKKKIVIPFKMINNLTIIPLEVNGAKLNFLLDTGVEKTVLFSLDVTDSISFRDVEKIRIKGLGEGEPIDALLAKNNKIKIKNFEDVNHDIYIVLDQNINFSSQLGIPVHGILGFEFFKNYMIKIDYQSKKVIVYNHNNELSQKKLKSYNQIPFTLELQKPYLSAKIIINAKEIPVKLLIDNGSSDALWLFENDQIKVPANYFDDLLGQGISGSIFGKRSRIEQLTVGEKIIDIPTASFPSILSLQNVDLVVGRNGSLGSSILRKFDVVFDYPNKKLYLKNNSNFDDPLNYDMSGLEIQHDGQEWIEDVIPLKTKFESNALQVYEAEKTLKYSFILKPVFKITNVRPNSPADKIGIKKDDKIISIFGNLVYKYKLDEITKILQSDEGRTIKIQIDRKGQILNFKFILKKIL
jgi:hypothetical protein